MKIRTFRYYAGEAFRNIIKNRLMSVASILTVASCIFIVSIFYCLAANVNYLLNRLESTIEITVFVRDDLSGEDVIDLSEKISEIPHVDGEPEYVSAQDALEEYTATLPDKRIAAGLEEDNPLRRSFNITITDLRYQEDVINALTEMKPMGVDNILHIQGTANIVLAISNAVRAVCMVLILILAGISIVIITNTIRITVNARRNEINIMKYVGATDWFIRWPFIIEGVLIGLLGGIIPSVICGFGYGRVIEMIKNTMPVLEVDDFFEFMPGYDIFVYLIPFALVLGIIIGVTGSFFSIRKHLKV